MPVSEKYFKNERKGRRTKVSSINLEFYQSQLLKEKGLNLSLLVRDLLDLYLSREFPERYKVLKEAELSGLLTQADDEELENEDD